MIYDDDSDVEENESKPMEVDGEEANQTKTQNTNPKEETGDMEIDEAEDIKVEKNEAVDMEVDEIQNQSGEKQPSEGEKEKQGPGEGEEIAIPEEVYEMLSFLGPYMHNNPLAIQKVK